MKCFNFKKKKKQTNPSSLLETVRNLVALSITALIMVLKYHYSLKLARLLGEMADSRSGTGNIHVEPGIFCHTRQQVSY